MSRQYMLKNAQKDHRPEQLKCANILRKIIDVQPGYIKTEYPVNNLVWDGKRIGCVLDIAIIPSSVQYKIAIRLMGEIHTKKRNQSHDNDQKSALEIQGWTVFDIWDWQCPNLWSKDDSEENYKLSEQEIRKFIA